MRVHHSPGGGGGTSDGRSKVGGARESMRAALIREYGKPLAVEEVADPIPARGQVLVKVKAAGICGTDLKVTGGVFRLGLPLIPGHEIAGEIVGVGDDVSPTRVGERVACYYYGTCGECFWCVRDQENMCQHVNRLGFERDGGMAEYVAVEADNALPVPDSVPYAVAAAAMDAVTTPWRALRRRLRLQPGETVAVIGAGGLGLNAIQVAVSSGARVAVVEPLGARRSRALELGCELSVAPDEVEKVSAWSAHGVDLVVEMSGSQSGLALAVQLVRPGGRIGVIGYSSETEFAVSSAKLVLEELTITGCRGGSLLDAREALDALGRGVITLDVAHTLPLGEVNVALEMLRHPDFVGRIVLDVEQ